MPVPVPDSLDDMFLRMVRAAWILLSASSRVLDSLGLGAAICSFWREDTGLGLSCWREESQVWRLGCLNTEVVNNIINKRPFEKVIHPPLF